MSLDAVFRNLDQSLSQKTGIRSKRLYLYFIDQLDAKILDVYSKVGQMLARYRSGKLPKALKVLPKIKNWPEVLQITNPEGWTPNATYQVTRIFISALSPKLAEAFVRSVLLPKFRDDVMTNKKLNSHLYEALKKTLYKPAAFFRGLVFPLCQESDVTLKEATIMASVIERMSIPILHSAAALLKLCSFEYSGPRSIFIKALLDKKYALPQRVVDAVAVYFNTTSNGSSEEVLPVLWQQSLLIFCQRYRDNFSEEQIKLLKDVAEKQHHDLISREIVLELNSSRMMQP